MSARKLCIAPRVRCVASVHDALLFSFEKGREELEEKMEENLKPVLTSLFGELTLLGFIGLTLFLTDKIEGVHTLSE